MGPYKAVTVALAFVVAGVAAQPAAPQATGMAKASAGQRRVYLIGTLRVTRPRIDTDETAGDEAPAYLVVENRSEAPERLVAASVAGAASVSLAPSEDAAPAPDGGLVVPGNGTLTLAPGEAHLVLHGLQGALPKGPAVTGTIRFARAGTLHLSFQTDPNATATDQTAPSSRRPVTLGQ